MSENYVEIRVKNCFSKVVSCPSAIKSSLINALSIKVPGYFFSSAFKKGGWDGREYFLSPTSGVFPTGLLPHVYEFLTTFEIPFKIHDERVQNLSLETVSYGYTLKGGKTLRDYQVDAINDVSSNSCFDIPFQRGIINIATNGGKTVIAEAIMEKLFPSLKEKGGILLFLTHSKEIASQVRKSIKDDLGIESGFIGSGKAIIKPITVGIVTTLYSWYRNESPMLEFLTKKVFAVIADESHHASAEGWNKVLNSLKFASIRIGLTGTVDKKKPLEMMRHFSVLGTVVTRLSNEFLIANEVSAKPVCCMFKISQPDLFEFDYQTAYSLGIVHNSYRNKLISKICEYEVLRGNTVLVLVEHIEHGQNLLKLIQKTIKSSEFTYGQLTNTQRETNLDDLKTGKLDVLISSAILDEGVDVSGINSIIYARGTKSTRKLLQGIGRGLRLKQDKSNLKFYDFIDDTHRNLLKHSKERFEILLSENFKVTLGKYEDNTLSNLPE